MVVEAELDDAIGKRLLFDVDHDEKANGPLPDAMIDTVEPASYQPSPVGLAPELEYEPLLVVVSVHAAAVEAGEAAIGQDDALGLLGNRASLHHDSLRVGEPQEALLRTVCSWF